jgi:diguanylate cyclase (GGDEF)-like protein
MIQVVAAATEIPAMKGHSLAGSSSFARRAALSCAWRCLWPCVWAATLLAPLPATASAQLDALEGRLRGRPEIAAPALADLARQQPAGSADQIETLLARGSMLVRLADAAAVEQAAQALAQLAVPADAAVRGTAGAGPAPAAAADLLRAAWMARHGALAGADRSVSDAIARLGADTPPALRLRFVAAQAKIKESLGRLDDAVRLNQQAVLLADRVGPAWRRAEQRSALAYSLFLAQQTAGAEAANREAMALATESADALALYRVLTNEGIRFGALGQPAEELRALQGAIDEARRAGARQETLLGMANLADHYLKHGDYATTLRLSQEALPLARELHDPITESVALTNAGLALISLGRRDEGLAFVRDALVIEERAGGLTAMAQIQRELGLYLEKAGFLADAWAAFVEHRRLADEVFQRQHQQAVLEAQESFESERRRLALALLNTEKGLGEARLTGRALQQRLWLVASIGALLLLAVVGLLLRRMRRSNAALQTSNAQLQVASETDPLTGLANRRHFQQRMKEAAADGALQGSLMLIDIDHFKRINDTHGHATGDAVLVEVAQRLRAALREEDLTVRWGGEEFLIVVRDLPAEQVEALAERLLAAVGGEPVPHGRQRIAVTASIGFATFPLRPQLTPLRWERAVDLVDTAMYLAKAHGRNRAYGVRALLADDATARQPQASTLESAWREGRAELSQHAGPAAVATAVAALSTAAPHSRPGELHPPGSSVVPPTAAASAHGVPT